MVGMSALVGCSDLNEKILDEYNAAGLTDKQAADGMITPVYAVLPTIFQHTTLFALQEISTDEAILPYRGGTDWGDNGIFIALHKHEKTSMHAEHTSQEQMSRVKALDLSKWSGTYV